MPASSALGGVQPRKRALAMPALGLLFLLLVTLPELWAIAHPPAGQVYRLSFWTSQDVAPYLTAMKDAASSSSWLVTDRLTPEPHSATLIYPLYILVAKGARALALPMETAFLVFLEASRLFFLGSLYLFVTTFVTTAPQRRLAFVAVLGSGGLAFLWLFVGALLAQPSLVESLAIEWRYLEVNTFIAMYGYPHLLVALSCLLLLAAFWYRYLREGRGRDLGVVIGALLLLGLANPFSLVPVGAVVGARTGVELLFRRLDRRQVVTAIVVLVIATPFLAFNYLTFGRDPFWSTVYGTQNEPHLLTPSLPALLSGLGLVLPLAAVGAAVLLKQRAPHGQFLATWAVVLLALMLAPLPYQRRFGLGLHPVLALLAFVGLSFVAGDRLWRSLGSVSRAVVRDLAGVGLFASTLGAYLLVVMGSLGQGPLANQSFASATTVEAAKWLANHSGEQDVILCDKTTCNSILRYVRGRAVYAHDIATLDPERKAQEVEAFYQETTSDSWRQALLRQYAVSFVVHGPREQALGSFSPDEAPYLSEVHQVGDVRLYSVRLLP